MSWYFFGGFSAYWIVPSGRDRNQARWSPGVVRLVMDGITPAVVPDTVVTSLKAREVNGLIELPPPPRFRRGDRVRVLHGPLAGHVGLFAGMKPRERVAVLKEVLEA